MAGPEKCGSAPATGADPVKSEKCRYSSYLLRLWPVEEHGNLVWRASLQSSHTGERWGFANLDALLSFLGQRTARTCHSGTRKVGDRGQEETPQSQ
jgi:hypothetical protein